MDKEQLKRHIHKSDLTAIEKRYLETLVDAQYKTDGRRLIDADALFKCDTCYHMQNGGCTTFCDSVESYRPDMSKLEIIEAEPVKHGRWIGVQFDEFFECSVCGDLTDWKLYDYCPNCGAKMDKGE